ncbi:hypothetical protein NKG05_02250 [Oerskovia sp. M15]
MTLGEESGMGRDLQGELEAVEAAWGRAIVANDADAIGRFMTDDWQIVGRTASPCARTSWRSSRRETSRTSR